MAKADKTPAASAKAAAPKAAPQAATAKAAAAPAQGTYTVGSTPILQGGQRFEPGDSIELTEAQAKRLGLAPAQGAAPSSASDDAATDVTDPASATAAVATATANQTQPE